MRVTISSDNKSDPKKRMVQHGGQKKNGGIGGSKRCKCGYESESSLTSSISPSVSPVTSRSDSPVQKEGCCQMVKKTRDPKVMREAVHEPTGSAVGYLTSCSYSCSSESPTEEERGQMECPFRQMGKKGKKLITSGSGNLLLLGVAAAAFFIYCRISRSN